MTTSNWSYSCTLSWLYSCNCKIQKTYINAYYEQLAAALQSTAVSTNLRIKSNSAKPVWNDELDRLKSYSIFWHNMWQGAGRPSSGVLQRTKALCKLRYKNAVHVAYVLVENAQKLLSKKPNEIWKSWNSKFRKKISTHIIFPDFRQIKMSQIYLPIYSRKHISQSI